MINANELRIGNWVELDGKYITVFNIDRDNDGGWINYVGEDQYNPIQLSPEILEKCGFSKTSYEDQSWYEYQSENGIIFCEGDKNGYCEVVLDFYTQVRVRYLHQLQNLYFALTGTELKVKL